MTFEVKDGAFAWPRGRTLFENVSFSLPEGGVLCVLGANGSGKTTLVKCMMGLLRWREGASCVDGVDLRQLSGAFWRRAAYVPQARPTAFGYTGLEMALLGRGAHLGLFRQPGARDERIARDALEAVGAGHLADRPLSRVSGGELQLALIARALAAEPELMALDEPESGLDLRNRLMILETVRRLRDERGISFIINTHQPEHALSLGGQALLLPGDGRALVGPVEAVLTEANLSQTFGVDVRIREAEIDGVRRKGVFVILDE